MFEPKLISPMLDNFMMGAPISEHHGIRCCPAMPQGTDKRYIVKIISVPAAQTQLDALLLTGAYPDEASALQYFASVAEDIKRETEVLSQLSKNEGFIPFEGCQIVPMEDAVGYDVYLLSPYKRSVARFFQKETMTHLKAVNLGLDMCAALALCRQAGYLYVDLKPENIYVDADGEYRIGDLGFVKLDSLKYASLPDKYRSSYTAPEVQDVYANLNDSLDIYAAGLVLYQAYNGGVLPFTGSAPAEALPAPIFADYEMAEIILKACDPDPARRWANPVQMGQALVSYMQRNGANDTPIVPAPVSIPVPSPEEAAEDAPEETVADTAEVEAAEEVAEDAAEAAEVEAAEDSPEVVEAAEEAAEPAQTQPNAEDENGQFCMLGFGAAAPEEASEAAEVDLPKLSQDTGDEAAADPDEEDHLAFMDTLISDDTAPDEQTAQATSYDELSQDITDMLTQADALIAHDTPAPVVAPEAPPLPDLPSLAEEKEEEKEAAAVAVAELEAAEAPVTEAATDDTAEEEAPEDAAKSEEEEEASDDDAAAAIILPDVNENNQQTSLGSDDFNADYEVEQTAPFNWKKLLIIVLALALLAGLIFGGYYFYKEYYLQSVTSLTLDGTEDSLTVYVKTAVDESLLSVVCVDTYGTKQVSPVVNGVATFSDLNPSTLYSIRVEISGMHKLRGEISDSYSTPVQTNIVSLTAVTGNESGSAIINFTVDGADSGNWLLTYNAEGETQKTHSFSGHQATITSLTLGKTYTFQLSSTDGVFLTGETQLEYVAAEPVYPENLHVTAQGDDGIRITWDCPEDKIVETWIVHCNNNSGFNQTVTVTGTEAEFSGLDFSKAHNIEVKASGMSKGVPFYMQENTVFISNESANVTSNDTLTVTWESSAAVSGQWIVQYSIEGLEDAQDQIVRTSTTSATIRPIIPNATYHIEIKLDNGTTVLGQKISFTTPEAAPFQGHILGYLVRNTPIEFYMCKRPDSNEWNHGSIHSYTSTFSAGDPIGFVGHIPGKYNPLTNTISIMYIYRDENGAIVACESTTSVWRNLWYQRYSELNAPDAPQASGKYTVEIYFDGYLAHQQEFTVE